MTMRADVCRCVPMCYRQATPAGVQRRSLALLASARDGKRDFDAAPKLLGIDLACKRAESVLIVILQNHLIARKRRLRNGARLCVFIDECESENVAVPMRHRVLYLGKLYEQSFHLSTIVEPILHSLAASTKESASYYVIDKTHRLCLFRAEPSEGLRETRFAGTSLPLDDTAISQVLRYWGLGEPLYESAPALPLFTAGARDGHTAAFATPVFGASDKFMAALTLSGPASRLAAAHKTGELISLQLNAAADLSRKLGASIAFCEYMYTAR